MQLSPLSLSLLIPTMILLVLTFMAWRRIGRPGAVPCGFLMLAFAVYAFGYAIELSSTTLESHMDATRFSYVGIAFIPPLLVLFACQLLRYEDWFNRYVHGLLFGLGSITLGLFLTNGSHHLVYSEIWLEPIGSHTVLRFKPGLWYWIHVAYIDLAVLLCLILVLHQRLRAAPAYRAQLNLMIVCYLCPWVGHLLYLLGLSPYGMDLAPFALTVSGAGFVLGLRHYGILDLVPIARRIVFDNMVDGVLVLDMRSRLVDLNPAATRFVGITKDRIGHPVHRLSCGNGDRTSSFCSREEGRIEILDGNAASPGGFEANIAPILDRGQKPLGRLIVMRDISERKAAEAERLEMERRLLHAQRLESLGVLAGGIAHDFNNLLMVVHGNIEMARLLTDSSAPVRVNLDNAMRGAGRAADLTRQMLAYAGKGQFQQERLDLNRLVCEMVDFLKMSVPKHVDLVPPRASSLPPFLADRGQVEQVIMNIVLNAAEAVEEGRGKVTIGTGVQECSEKVLAKSRLHEKPDPGRYLCLDVTDNGCGMDEKTLERLFDPFFSTKFVGRGLGMSAVLGIVRRHKGAIMVDTEPGRGTAIQVFFPVADEVEPMESLSEEVSNPLTADSMVPLTGTVLVVDDEDAVLSLCTAMLERFGLTVLAASRGSEAVELLKENVDTVNCVVLDLTMPEMDGLAVFRELVRIRPGLNVLLASGYGAGEYARHFGDSGFAGFLQKPYRLEFLHAEVRRVLRQ